MSGTGALFQCGGLCIIYAVRRLRRWGTLLLVAGACTIGVSGCGGGAKQHKAKHTVATRGSATASSSRAAPAAGSVGAIVDVDTQAAINQPIQYRVAIHDLRRSGPFVTLDFALTCLSSMCLPSYDLAQGAKEPGAASGVELVDPAAGLEYQVVKDAQNRGYTSSLGSMTAGQTVQVWATYPVPPASVTAMDVLFGNGGAWIHDIPVSSAAAPDPATWGGSVTPATAAPFSQPPNSTSTAGLTLPVLQIESAVGNKNGSDQESGHRSTISLSADVLFRFGKSSLTAAAHSILDEVAHRISHQAVGPVTVTGYTDSIGTDAVNIPLSQARAGAVVGALQPRTAAAHVHYTARGLGSADPVAPNTTSTGADNPAGRTLNRRVTISYAVAKPMPPAPPPVVAAPSTTPSTGPQTVKWRFTVPTTGSTPTYDYYNVTAAKIVRNGRFAVLALQITCDSESPASSIGCDSLQAFAAGTSSTAVPPQSAAVDSTLEQALESLTAVYLTDPRTGTEYIGSRDPDNNAVGSLIHTFPQGYLTPAWQYFAAPPASATSMTVSLPGGTTKIYGVPVVDGPAETALP